MKAMDLTGQTFGRLLVTSRETDGARRWICSCSCGSGKVVRTHHLRDGMSTSCGCRISESSRARHAAMRAEKLAAVTYRCSACRQELPLAEFSRHRSTLNGHSCTCKKCLNAKNQAKREANRKPRAPRLRFTSGQRFGALTVLNEPPVPTSRTAYKWHCICDCGTKKLVSGARLKNGEATSCSSNKKHCPLGKRRSDIKYAGASEKPCLRCKKVLPVDSFYRSSSLGCGRMGFCITCAKAHRKLYHPIFRERVIRQMSDSYIAHLLRLKRSELTPGIAAAKRAHLRAKRLIGVMSENTTFRPDLL